MTKNSKMGGNGLSKTKSKEREKPHRKNLDSNKVDIISEIPVEISRIIFEMLTAKQLEQCLFVSKKWRSRANVNILWKKHCLDYDITEDDMVHFQNKQKGDLCEWGVMWFMFKNSPAFHWKTKSWKLEKIKWMCNQPAKKPPIFKRLISDGKTVVTWEGSKLTLRKIPYINNVTHTITIPFNVDHLIGTRVELAGSYVSIKKYNIIVVYKIDGFYNTIPTALAIYRGSIVTKTGSTLSRFIKRYLLPTMHINEINFNFNFCGEYLWINENRIKNTVIFDLNKRSFSFVKYYKIYNICTEYLVRYEGSKLSIDTYDGRNIFTMDREAIIVGAVASQKTAALLVRNADMRLVLEIWDIFTKCIIWNISCVESIAYMLHHSDDIIYSYQTGKDLIKAIKLSTGKTIWARRLPLSTSTVTLKVICNIYIAVLRENSKTFYILHAKTGKFIFGAARTSGVLSNINDSIMLIESELNRGYLFQMFCN